VGVVGEGSIGTSGDGVLTLRGILGGIVVLSKGIVSLTGTALCLPGGGGRGVVNVRHSNKHSSSGSPGGGGGRGGGGGVLVVVVESAGYISITHSITLEVLVKPWS
jgi:hypothetical protein